MDGIDIFLSVTSLIALINIAITIVFSFSFCFSDNDDIIDFVYYFLKLHKLKDYPIILFLMILIYAIFLIPEILLILTFIKKLLFELSELSKELIEAINNHKQLRLDKKLDKKFKNIICYNKNNELQFRKTFLNKNKIIEKINKKLKYINFNGEKINKYFLIFDKNSIEKINKKSCNGFKYEITTFLKENNVELTNVEKLIEENNEKSKTTEKIKSKEHNQSQDCKDILNNIIKLNRNNQNNQLDKLNCEINNIKN